MKRRTRKLWTRTKLALRQNRAAVGFVLAWIALGFAAFSRIAGLGALDAALAAVCVAKATVGWASAYQSFTEVVVFGAVASVVVTNVTQKYRPEATSRALASEADGHAVVIGFTNLGRRVHDLVVAAGKEVVVVEEDAAKVAELVLAEEPLVVGPPRDRLVLADAGIERAKVVVVATDDLETAAVACRLVREANGACELVVRCSDEDVAAVLAKTYRARPVSTTRLAAEFVRAQAQKARARRVVVLGEDPVADAVAATLERERVTFVRARGPEDATEALAACDLVVLCEDDLGKNLLRVDRVRDVTKRARIICRAFHEDAAEILRRAPFECVVLSTSRHAADALARAGAFRGLGIDDAPAKAAPAMLAGAC